MVGQAELGPRVSIVPLWDDSMSCVVPPLVPALNSKGKMKIRPKFKSTLNESSTGCTPHWRDGS